jgi:ABC-type uncharacterized transport system substrate-binding protein
MKKGIRVFILFLACLMFILAGQGFATSPKKVFLVFSYHPTLFWHTNAEKGVRDALKGFQCEYRSFYMDTKHHSKTSWIHKTSKEAIRQIQDFRPDLLIGFDDNACHFVLSHFLGTSLPMVFLGVNRNPEDYGFVKGSRENPKGNVTGVLERHYFLQSVQLFSGLLGKSVLRIGLLSDSSETSHTMVARFMKIARKKKLPILFFKFAYSLPAWKEIIREAQEKLDLLIIYNCETLKGKGNKNISRDDVIAWTITHNQIPEVSFFSRYIKKGLMGGIVLTGYYQGFYAGKKAALIFRGTPPGDISIDAPPKGTIALNMKRVRSLGLKIPLGILQSATLMGQTP